MALQSLPVRFAIDRAGLVGADGPTHAGGFDGAYLSCLPNMVAMAASDEAELARMLSTSLAYDAGPSAPRYPRGEGTGVAVPLRPAPLEIGRVVKEGGRIAILSPDAPGLPCTAADARFAKPLDRNLILRLAREHEAIITIEEGAVGGFGAHALQTLAGAGALDRGLKIRTMNLPDSFIDHDAPRKMYAAAGLNARHIVAAALSALGAEHLEDAARAVALA